MRQYIAIMQPTYFPWIGYFSMIERSSVFVFLDDVQFAKRSWQQRNRVNSPNGECFINIPVYSKNRYDQKIHEVQIVDIEMSIKKLKKKLHHCYSKSVYIEEFFEILDSVNSEEISGLGEFNIKIIKAISNKIGIKTDFKIASENSFIGKKSERLIDICQHYNIKNYLSAPGSIKYINDEGYFSQSDVSVFEFIYVPGKYRSINMPFLENMSIIDAIMNLGFRKTKLLLDNFEIRRCSSVDGLTNKARDN